MNTLRIPTTIINIFCITVLLIIFFAGQLPCQQDNIPSALNTTCFVHFPALNMPMRSKEAANRRKEEETMTAATLVREESRKEAHASKGSGGPSNINHRVHSIGRCATVGGFPPIG